MHVSAPFPLGGLAATAAVLALSTPVWGLDGDAAQALAKKSECFKCHSVDKKKDGPSFKETAARLTGKADAENQIVKHLTTSPKVKVDGKEEEHKAVKASEADVRNLAQWILSR